jgi:hypothetical protein
MKKILALICILSMFAFLSPAGAIDRTSKGSDKEKKEDTTGNKAAAKEGATQKSRSEALSGKTVREGAGKYKVVSEKSESDKKESKPKEPKERYDYFRDANNNGVDDRLEKKTKKEEAKPIQKTPATKEKAVPTKIVPSTPKQDIPKSKQTKESSTKEPKKEVKPKNPSKRSDKDDN